jgi:CBS domain containing-hemolysin-like protein
MTSADAWLLVLSVVLVLIAGLLVGTETALARVSRVRAEEMAESAPRSGARLLRILESRPRYINVLLFLSTVCTVTATALLAVVAIDWLSGALGWSTGASLTTAIAVMVVVSYVVLGVAPRTLGRQHADVIALRTSGLTRAIGTVLSPLASLLIAVGNALTPGKGYREGPFASQAEFRELVDLAGDDQLIEPLEARMIHSVFELGDTLAREVMVPRTEVIFIERGKALRQLISLGLRSGYSRIPVIGESVDDVIGIIYLKDVVRRVFDHRESEMGESVEAHMRPAYFVPDSKKVDDLLREMQAHRVHLAVVIDEYGGTAGIVTIEDILEEIVGEIADEHDTEQPEVVQLADEVFRVSSRLHLDDLAELINISIDSDDEGVDSLLGLMAKRLERVPIPGASVDVDGWTLIAERGQGRRNRIASVIVKRSKQGDGSDD